jgi:LacI family transcriptional regulator
MKSATLHLTVLLETRFVYSRRILAGILDVAAEEADIQVDWAGPDDPRIPGLLKHTDGLIFGSSQWRPEYAKRFKVTVQAAGGLREGPTATVLGNSHLIGSRVADYLLKKGFRHLAHIGVEGFPQHQKRMEGFVGSITADKSIHFLELESLEGIAPIAQFLKQLPKPAGIMVESDLLAMTVLEIARAEGIDVPGELALVGVDNDPLLCRLCRPRLSSIDPGSRRIGTQAALLACRLARGTLTTGRVVTVDPGFVVDRQSSDIYAATQPALRNALRHIRDNACGEISVDEVCRAAHVNRRQLERQFQKEIGTTIHEEITRFRMQRAKQLLVDTRRPVSQILHDCGYAYPSQFAAVFRKSTGISPSAYRKQYGSQYQDELES